MRAPKPWRNRFVRRLVTAVSVPAAERPFARSFPYEIVDQPRRRPPPKIVVKEAPKTAAPPPEASPAAEHWRWVGGILWRTRPKKR
jgi:hypothetical protein